MIRKLFGISVLVFIAISLLNSSGCARSQTLTGLTIQPSGGFVFEGYNATGQFTAFGTYIHPPVTKDLTSQVTWSIDIGNFGTISPSGLITYTRTDGCGSGNAVATITANGSVFTADAPVRGVNDGSVTCQ